MITGYLFWNKFLQHPGLNTRQLFVGRVLRIGPLYAATSVVAMLLVASTNPPLLQLGLHHFIAAFYLGSHNFDTMPWAHLDIGMAWSLKYELLFYAALPFLVMMRLSLGPLIYHGFIGFMLYTSEDISGLALFMRYLWVGAIAAELWPWMQSLPVRYHNRLFPLLRLSTVILFVAIVVRGEYWHSAVQIGLFFFLFIGFLSGADLFGFLKSRLMHVLGRFSYSTYLIHGCLLHLSIILTARWINFGALSEIDIYLYFMGFSIPLFVISAFSFKYIEMPGMSKPLINQLAHLPVSLPRHLIQKWRRISAESDVSPGDKSA